MPIHLRAEPGDYAPAVLCPGDPRRAEYIASSLFADARLVNEERGMLGFTGTFDGKPISVQSTGMGCPSASIVFEELVQLGCNRLIRVGTCGALQPGMNFADTLCALSAVPSDHTALTYTGGEAHAPTADWRLVESAVGFARETGQVLHVGPIVTSDVFYDPDEGRTDRWAARGLLGIEMETAVLYTIGGVRRVSTLTLLTVSDILYGEAPERVSDQVLREGVDAMMRLAARVAVADLI